MNQISPDFLARSRDAFHANQPPTLAELRSRVEADTTLGKTKRRDLLSALNRLPTWFERPLAAIPATAKDLRELFDGTTAPRHNLAPKTVANVRSLVVQVVTRYGPPQMPITRKIPLDTEWRNLLDRIVVLHNRHALGRLAAYASVMNISPAEVVTTTLLGLHRALEAEELVKDPRSIIKNTITSWNRCRRQVNGWPDVILESPFKKRPVTFPLSTFPVTFRDDVNRWKTKVTDEHSLDEDAPAEPLAATTVELRVVQIRGFASALVHRRELQLEEITSLSALFTPARFTAGLRWFLERPHNDDSWRLYHMAHALVRIAKHHCKLDEETLKRLTAIAKKLKPRGPLQMSARNRARLRQFDDPRGVAKLLKFPQDQLARAGREKNPYRAAKRVERGLAVALMFCGLRQATLRKMQIKGDFSWTRSNFEGVCHLHVPGKKVKNKRPVERELSAGTAELLRLYLTVYRSRLPGSEGSYLFPGVTGGIRARSQFGEGLSRAFRKDTGLDIHPHLIRHAIAKVVIERDPGAYLAVSRVLGHASLNTTLGHYLGTETKAAARHIDRLLTEAKEEFSAKPGRRRNDRTDKKPDNKRKKGD